MPIPFLAIVCAQCQLQVRHIVRTTASMRNDVIHFDGWIEYPLPAPPNMEGWQGMTTKAITPFLLLVEVGHVLAEPHTDRPDHFSSVFQKFSSAYQSLFPMLASEINNVIEHPCTCSNGNHGWSGFHAGSWQADSESNYNIINYNDWN